MIKLAVSDFELTLTVLATDSTIIGFRDIPTERERERERGRGGEGGERERERDAKT